jgi:hypothetical protein
MGRTMLNCKLLEHCPFFHDETSGMPLTARELKKRYCKAGSYHACARYVVFKKLGNEKIPADLFPNQQDRLTEILDFL